MSAAVVTINATIGEIEELLVKGMSVEAVAHELCEPRNNVIAVWERWRRNNGIAPDIRPAPAPPATASAPPALHGWASQTVASLIAASERSASKQTVRMGERFSDAAQALRARLVAEREAAEAIERERAEREAALAEVARLEAQLVEARQKAGVAKRAGAGASVKQPDAALACRKGCGRPNASAAGRAAHERHCEGGPS